MVDISSLTQIGLIYVDEYCFDDTHHSFIFKKGSICIIVDDDICKTDSTYLFDYSKYCEMQNTYMASYSKVYRFNCIDDSVYQQIADWLNKAPENIEVSDSGGTFDIRHIDNTPLEKSFEDLFVDAYGDNSIAFLKKEYSISLSDGKNAFIDYVVETKDGNYAIEENGVHYHHPCIIGNDDYAHQLEKQNTLVLYNFKVFRFSIQNLSFSEQAVDNIKKYLGNKDRFINSICIKEERKFKLYEHQEKILDDLHKSRQEGICTALIVIPTGTGKSQIVIEDLKTLSKSDTVHNVLIMVPSITVKNDWIERAKSLPGNLHVDIKFYNTAFLEKNSFEKNYYDYIVFDEAHHAQAANCKKTLQYYTPKYLLGLTATPERLDQKKLEDIFGHYESRISLKDAVEKGILSNIRCYRLLSNIDLSNVRYNGTDYNYADLEKSLIIDSRNELIADTIKKYFLPHNGFFKQGIVFCVNINHAKKLEKMLCERGIVARAVFGANSENDEIFDAYKNRKIQFLISCQIISEGWDSPQTEIVVMARPTLSKVLYLQQIGRGVRKYPGKECLYIIDVVDNYEGKLTPWSFNSLFKIPQYSDFAGLKNNSSDYLSILGLSECEVSMQEIDVFTFEEKYQGYLSLEQAARELFIGTNTLSKWVKDKPTYSSLSLPIGNKMMPYFSPENIAYIKQDRNLKEHNNETILDDFLEFINENTLTFSFKLVFMLGMLNHVDKEGEVNIDTLLDYYISFYKSRINRGLPVDKKNCIYTIDFLNERMKVKQNMLSNPFEKYERKRFVYYSKDLNILSFNPNLWAKLTEDIKSNIVEIENKFLSEYYASLGGL